MSDHSIGSPCADCVDGGCTMNCSSSERASGSEWIAASIWAGVFPQKASAEQVRNWRCSTVNSQTPDAVREAVAKVLYDFRPGCGWKTVKGRPASYAIPWDEACDAHKSDAYLEADAVLAALDSRAVPAGEVGLRQALGDAINSPKGVVPVSAEPFYDGRAGRVKPAEATPTAYLMTGRWELDPEGRSPGIYMEDPEGGGPICLCVVKRVYHPDLLSASLSHGEGRK